MAFFLFLAIGILMLPGSAAGQTACHDLEQLTLPAATISSAVEVAADASGPAYCRVIGVATPTSDSRIGFEVWLPIGSWNGKFQQVGNGGFAGGIPQRSMLAPLRHGYATAGTDDGHQSPDMADARWSIGHPERVIDFGYRAVHVTSVHAKAIIAAFYGRAASQAYFVGCSDGGREALMEAQRYPDDFNGIAAGAPANYWTRLLTGGVWVQQALNAEPGSALPPEKLSVLQRAAVAACDAQDAVKDGIITDPTACRFDPKTVQCAGADDPGCLTPAQVTAAAKIYSGPKNPRTGEEIYPGYAAGTESLPTTWRLWLTGSDGRPAMVADFAKSFFGDMVFANPNWDFKRFDFDRDVETATKKTATLLDADSPDLSAFKARGGIGATDLLDPLVTALDRWVVEGLAPDHLIATGTVPEDPAKPITRPVCPYPQVPTYTGHSDTNEAANFVCRAKPARSRNPD